MVFGHGANTFTRMPAAARGLEKIDLLVVADPHPTTWAVLGERKNGTYLLPTCTQYESRGTRTASNGSLQAYQQIVKPLFESKHDGEIIYLLAKKLGFADQMFKNIKVDGWCAAGRGCAERDQSRRLVTGYTGQSPDRLKAHLRNQAKFDPMTLRAPKDDPEVGGDYYGLPWPCWGKPDLQASGHADPLQHQPARDGGRRRVPRALRRRTDGHVARRHHAQGQSAGRRLLLGRLGNPGRISGVHLRGAEEARLGQGPQAGGACRHRAHRRRQPGRHLVVDRSLRRHSARGACARLQSIWQRQGARQCVEPAGSDSGAPRADLHPRPELVAKYPTLPNASSSGCRIWASTCRRRRWRRALPSNSR